MDLSDTHPDKKIDRLHEYIANEIALADDSLAAGDHVAAKHHLERAHILGQAFTADHTRVHFRMLRLGWRMRDVREVVGQLIRIVGAATKTPFGIYPTGNTGGADVWFFQSRPIPDDLLKILNEAKLS